MAGARLSACHTDKTYQSSWHYQSRRYTGNICHFVCMDCARPLSGIIAFVSHLRITCGSMQKAASWSFCAQAGYTIATIKSFERREQQAVQTQALDTMHDVLERTLGWANGNHKIGRQTGGQNIWRSFCISFKTSCNSGSVLYFNLTDI